MTLSWSGTKLTMRCNREIPRPAIRHMMAVRHPALAQPALPSARSASSRCTSKKPRNFPRKVSTVSQTSCVLGERLSQDAQLHGAEMSWGQSTPSLRLPSRRCTDAMKGRAQFFAVFPGFSLGRVLGAGDSGSLPDWAAAPAILSCLRLTRKPPHPAHTCGKAAPCGVPSVST